METTKTLIAIVLAGAIGLAGCSKEGKKVFVDKQESSIHPCRILVDSNKDGMPDRTEVYMVQPGHVGGYALVRNPTTEEIDWYQSQK